MKQILRDYLSLAKPRLSSMVVITAGCGLLLAKSTRLPMPFDSAVAESLFSWRDVLMMLGTSGIVAAANALNCVLEKDVDALMERTQDRPLVQGRISVWGALAFSLILAVWSLWALFVGANAFTAFLGALGFLTYVGIYTPLKRRSMTALFAGAVPGAIPPMMGWTAVTGHADLGAWILFGILFFWQLPHFIAISMYRQSEYDAAGLKTVPGTLGKTVAGQQMLLFATLLVGVSLLPYPLGLAGLQYFVLALVLGILFVGLCVAGILGIKDLNWPRAVFLGSIAYLPFILGAWVTEKLH